MRSSMAHMLTLHSTTVQQRPHQGLLMGHVLSSSLHAYVSLKKITCTVMSSRTYLLCCAPAVAAPQNNVLLRPPSAFFTRLTAALSRSSMANASGVAFQLP